MDERVDFLALEKQAREQLKTVPSLAIHLRA